MKFMRQQKFFGILLLIVGQLLFSSAASADDNSTAAKEKRVADLKQNMESITYGAKKNPKAVIYVFTDMNCAYCRKLHHEFPKLAELGIQVRVLAMPRQGLDSAGYKQWVSIWCSNDPNDSLDRAMEGEDIAPKTCKNPIKTHYTLGRKWGVIGTPSVLFADGTLKAGYFSAEKLAKEAIKRSAAVEKEEDKDKEKDNKGASTEKAATSDGNKSDKSDKSKNDKAKSADKTVKDAKDSKNKDSEKAPAVIIEKTAETKEMHDKNSEAKAKAKATADAKANIDAKSKTEALKAADKAVDKPAEAKNTKPTTEKP